MKPKKIETHIYPNGAIRVYKKYSIWNEIRLFITGRDVDYFELYFPKKPYSNKEMSILSNFLYNPKGYTNEDNTVIINTVRPNTFKESILEIENSKYYVPAKIEGFYLYPPLF